MKHHDEGPHQIPEQTREDECRDVVSLHFQQRTHNVPRCSISAAIQSCAVGGQLPKYHVNASKIHVRIGVQVGDSGNRFPVRN